MTVRSAGHLQPEIAGRAHDAERLRVARGEDRRRGSAAGQQAQREIARGPRSVRPERRLHLDAEFAEHVGEAGVAVAARREAVGVVERVGHEADRAVPEREQVAARESRRRRRRRRARRADPRRPGRARRSRPPEPVPPPTPAKVSDVGGRETSRTPSVRLEVGSSRRYRSRRSGDLDVVDHQVEGGVAEDGLGAPEALDGLRARQDTTRRRPPSTCGRGSAAERRGWARSRGRRWRVRTRRRVSSSTIGRLFRTRDVVVRLTPARAATSLIVATEPPTEPVPSDDCIVARHPDATFLQS